MNEQVEWREAYLRVQEERDVALMEVKKWKDKYFAEKQRRRAVSKSLLDMMLQYDRTFEANQHRQSSSMMSDVEGLNCLLSPTLSSFDFDDDTSDSDGDGEMKLVSDSQEIESNGVKSLINTTRKKVRPRRSSTIDVYKSVWRSHKEITPQEPARNLIYYSNSSSGDICQAHTHPHRFQNIAKSILFSMNMKKVHLFEVFFVCGSQNPRVHNLNKYIQYCKPHILGQFPSLNSHRNNSSIGDFCFPIGIPIIQCSSAEGKLLEWLPISTWPMQKSDVIKNLLTPSHTNSYNFRLTGAKGEVLYGFCATLLCDVRKYPGVSSNEGFESFETAFSQHYRVLIPKSFCIISKFPFYRLHFLVLRMIVDAEIRYAHRLSITKKTGCSKSVFEVVVKTEVPIGLVFSLYHFKAEKLDKDYVLHSGSLNSISSVSSGELPHIHVSDDYQVSTRNKTSNERNFRKRSRSWCSQNDIMAVLPEKTRTKPIVNKILSHVDEALYLVKKGDILEAVHGINTDGMNLQDVTRIIEAAERPLKLRFSRICNTSKETSTLPCMSPETADILERVRRMKIRDPGEWSAIQLSEIDLNYQFPKKATERWSYGVALRLLRADTFVRLLGLLLLEKQVVICGKSSAEISALCTGLMMFLAPFQWQSTYIPLLPSNLTDFLHSPVPFFVGCHQLHSTEEWPDVCFYNVDNQDLKVPTDLAFLDESTIPNGTELLQLFSRCTKEITKVTRLSKPWYEISALEEHVIADVAHQSEKLLRSICGDIGSYKASDCEKKSFYATLQNQVTHELQKNVCRVFLEEFSQTQMFCQYCEILVRHEKMVTELHKTT